MTKRKMIFLDTDSKIKSLSRLNELVLKAKAIAEDLNETIDFDDLTGFQKVVRQSTRENPWFTKDNIVEALSGIAYMLRPEALEKWVQEYDSNSAQPSKRVGMVLAGNIPMVGFHDIFCTIVAGHQAIVKPSTSDLRLLPALFTMFEEALPEMDFPIEWVEGKLPKIDAVIATGSNNTSRYFEYYFKDVPHIIRKNRSSVAILNGEESDEELKELGKDIFSYFGMGCRSISKLYVHEDFELDRFFKSIYDYHPIVNHNKYGNNFDYYRALWMMNLESILENGFLILRPSEAIASPTSTLFFERYTDEDKVRESLKEKEAEIQCIVSKKDIPFGNSQFPELWDFADGVDTMKFLMSV